MKKAKITGVVTLVAVFWILVALPSACAADKIRIGYTPFSFNLPLYVALEKGFFTKRNLNVEAIRMKNSNETTEAMIAGKVDGTASTALQVALSIEQNVPGQIQMFAFHVFTKENYTDALMTKQNSNLQSILDLKGKKIGTFIDSQVLMLTRILLGKFIDLKDVQIIQIPPPAQRDALLSGSIDACLVFEPLRTLLLKTGEGKMMMDGPLAKEVMDPLVSAGFALSTTYVKTRADVAKRYVEAMQEAIGFYRTNRAEAMATTIKYTITPPDIAMDILNIDYATDSEFVRDSIRKQIDLFLADGILEKRVDDTNLYYSPLKRRSK